VLAPGLVVTLGEVVTGVGTAGLLSVLSSEHGHLSLDHQVLKLKGLNEIGVPDLASVSDAQIFNFSRELMESLATLLQVVLATEDSSVLLHGLLHTSSNLSSRGLTLAVSEFVQKGN
jgi:hypothetical protein